MRQSTIRFFCYPTIHENEARCAPVENRTAPRLPPLRPLPTWVPAHGEGEGARAASRKERTLVAEGGAVEEGGDGG